MPEIRYRPTFRTYDESDALGNYRNYFGHLPYEQLTDEAFQAWDDVSGLEYLRVQDNSLVPRYEAAYPDYRIYAAPLNTELGKTGVAGNAIVPRDHTIPPKPSWSDINMNYQNNYTKSKDGYYNTLKHEIGHGLGLYHSDDNNDLMYPTLKYGRMQLSDHDIEEAQAIYGEDISNRDMLLYSNVGPVASYYRAIFNRDPDNAGFAYNYNALDSGKVDMKGLASAFVNSTEFAGDKKSDEQFVNTFYGNIFNRTAAKEETDYWTGQLKAGNMDRADVLMHFAESKENQDKLLSLYGDTMWYDYNEVA